MDEKLKKLVKETVSEVMDFDISEVSLDKEINTISEWDSFNNLMLISKFQDELDTEFTATEIEEVLKIQDLYDLIKTRL